MTKKKILVLSDHPLSPSGVGTQTKYMIEALLKTGRYQFVCLGGAIKHHDYRPVKVEGWIWKSRTYTLFAPKRKARCFMVYD